MLFIDMLDLFVRPFIDDRVQTVDNAESDKRHADDEKDVSDRIGRLSERIGQKIETDDAQHHTARKTQKQTDDLLGIAREQHAEQSAQPRPRHACDRSHDDHQNKGILIFSCTLAARSSPALSIFVKSSLKPLPMAKNCFAVHLPRNRSGNHCNVNIIPRMR